MIESSAIISDCLNYRFLLTRKWETNLFNEFSGDICFIMLNPSTADSNIDDPTLRRCINFSKNWGFSTLRIVNLFAYRASNPDILKKINNPIGEHNDNYIINAATNSNKTIIAWGNNGNLFDRANSVLELLSEKKINSFAIQLTNSNQPKHPLYIKKDIKLQDLIKIT